MKKLIILLIMTVNIAFAGIQKDIDDFKNFDKISKKNLAKKMAKGMSNGSSLPLKLDEATTLLLIYSFNNNIIMKKELDITYPQIKNFWKQKKNKFIEYMLQIDSKNICYIPVWKYLIYKRNIIPEFNYVDKNNKPLFKYTIEIEDCNKLK